MIIYIGIIPRQNERVLINIDPHARPLFTLISSDIINSKECLEFLINTVNAYKGIENYGPGIGDSVVFNVKQNTTELYFDGRDGPEFPCIVPTEQLIRVLTRLYLAYKKNEPTYMELELLSFAPYFIKTSPISEDVKILPLIKLSDPIPLPEELTEK